MYSIESLLWSHRYDDVNQLPGRQRVLSVNRVKTHRSKEYWKEDKMKNNDKER